MREKLVVFLETRVIQHFIVGLIVFNSIIIGLETWPVYMEHLGHITDELDLIILIIFIIEKLLKIYAYGFRFFKSAWNVFDALVVFISVLPAAGSFAVFRALRILRTLRLLNNLPKLKLIIESLLHSLPSIGWIMFLLAIIFYIFAVIGNNLFGETFPQYFGSFGRSLFSLFQIMTLESWASGIARPVIAVHKLASVYFVSFILIATYTTLNIFIAIVVNTMNELHREEIKEEEEHIKLMLKEENKVLVQKIDALSADLTELKNHLMYSDRPSAKN